MASHPFSNSDPRMLSHELFLQTHEIGTFPLGPLSLLLPPFQWLGPWGRTVNWRIHCRRRIDAIEHGGEGQRLGSQAPQLCEFGWAI